MAAAADKKDPVDKKDSVNRNESVDKKESVDKTEPVDKNELIDKKDSVDKRESVDKKEKKDPTTPEPPRPAVYTFVQELLDTLFLKHEAKKAIAHEKKEGDVREDFKKQCNELNDSKYLGLSEHSYEETSARFAYILLHFTQQTYLVNSVLSDAYAACTNLQSRTTVFNELMRSVDWGRISVFSFGGGPAADVMGILMWLHRFGFNTRVQAATTDTCKQWESTANSIFKTMQFEMPDKEVQPTPQQKYTHNLWKKMDGNIKFFHSSLKAPTALFKTASKEMIAIGQADIITLPFAVSSVAEAPETSNAIQCVLDAMKPGALLVYLDHLEGPQTELINNLAYWCGLRRIYFMKEMAYAMPNYEKEEFLEPYSKDLDEPVVRETKVTAIVYKKPSGYSYDRRMKMSKRESTNIKQAQVRLRKSNPDFKLFRPSYY